jgi:tRNA (guanine37-N1)-methyltransferase
MLVIDTIIRHVPGVLGDETSSKYDSFAESGLLEHPQYTRPREFRGMDVPEVLLTGNHDAIARWQEEQSRRRTEEVRGRLQTCQASDDTYPNGPRSGKG